MNQSPLVYVYLGLHQQTKYIISTLQFYKFTFISGTINKQKNTLYSVLQELDFLTF